MPSTTPNVATPSDDLKPDTSHEDSPIPKEAEGNDLQQTLATLEASENVITPAMRRRSWIQFAALCYTFFYCGWGDGTAGPMILRFESVYHVGYAVVSLIFICSCVGYIIGVSSYIYLTDRFGFGVMIVVASLVSAIGVSIQASGAPFPAFVIAYVFTGVGGAFLDAGTNAYVAGLAEDTSTKMGIMHAVYGAGAMFAPLVSTQFAHLPRWSFVFLVHVGLVLVNIVIQTATFRLQSQEKCLADVGQSPPEKTKESQEGMSKYRQVLRLRAVHVMAFFIFLYCGVEVSIGGWIVTYVIKERHGGNNAGYISSGFWGGLTLGRVALLWFNRKIGEWRVIFIYVLLVLGLELVVWLVPDLVSSAICVSFVGFFLGPLFPIAMNHAGTIMPQELVAGAIGWIASFGSAGAAMFPFITGAIASGTSIGSLQPLLISMMGAMLLLWAFVPRTREQLK